jgi:REP element-mobilizing transposase RayT
MILRTKRDHLRQLVDAKNQAFRPLTDEERALGFLGWHERGYLPHCDYPALVQFVTFRLGDSMPASRRGEWEHFLKIEDVRERRTKLEEYLDCGMGECHLRDPRIAKLTEAALLHFHNERYELLAWCVMPNHIHVLVHVWRTPLDQMIQSWKRFVATRALRLIRLERRTPIRRDADADPNAPNRSSALQSFWPSEYWDTFMRDEEQERKAVRYIESNPVKAKLSRAAEDSPFGSGRFRNRFQRLIIPKSQSARG